MFSKKKNKETQRLLWSILPLAAVMLMLYGCPTSSGSLVTEAEVACDTTDVPSAIYTFIDYSHSMKSYFSPKSDDGRFVDALVHAGSEGSQFYWATSPAKKVPSKGNKYMGQILTSNFPGSDSEFDVMLNTMCATLNIDSADSDVIGLLFTDGIISISDIQNMSAVMSSIKSNIEKSIKNRGLAVALFQLKGAYQGSYYDYKHPNRPSQTLDCERPFYVIAIGRPQYIRWYMENNDLKAQLYDAWGVYTQLHPDTHYAFAASDPRNWSGSALNNGVQDVSFSIHLPDYIQKLDTETFDIKVTVDGAEYSGIHTKFINHSLTIYWNNFNVAADVPVISTSSADPSTLELTIFKKTSTAWSSLNSYDDTNIQNDTVEQGKTFALQHLIEGLRKGVQSDDRVVIFNATVNFSQQ